MVCAFCKEKRGQFILTMPQNYAIMGNKDKKTPVNYKEDTMNRRVWKVALITLLILGMLPLFAACSEKVPEEMEFQLVGDGSSYGVRMDEDYYLSELVIPSKYKGKPVTEILPEAIESAPNLEKVVIPSSIEKIGKDAFSGCKELETVCISDLDAWFAIEFESDTSNPLFYGADLLLNDEPVTSVTLPDDMTEVPDYLFRGCKSLTSVTVPEGVTSIGKSAFNACTSLVTVKLPSSLKTVEAHAFGSCEKLKLESLPAKLSQIGDHAFSHCTRFTAVEISARNVNIGRYAFSDCKKLTTFTLSGNNAHFADYAFSGCEKLTTFTLTGDDASFGSEVFNECYGLTTISIFGDGLHFPKHSRPFFYHSNALTTVHLPGNVTDNYNKLFEGCSKLESVTFGENFEIIGHGMFWDCTSLQEIELPAGAKVIEDFAFAGCTALTKLYLPNSITKIGSFLFSGCETLPTVYFDGTKAEWDAIEKEDLIGYGETLTVHCNDGIVTVTDTW